MVETIAVEKLVPAEDNPRRSVGDVTALAASITDVGDDALDHEALDDAEGER